MNNARFIVIKNDASFYQSDIMPLNKVPGEINRVLTDRFYDLINTAKRILISEEVDGEWRLRDADCAQIVTELVLRSAK